MMSASRIFPKYLLAIFPAFVLLIFVTSLNLISPKEPEAPQTAINQNLEKVDILLREPVSVIYPQKSNALEHQLFSHNLYDTLVSLKSGKLEGNLATEWLATDPNTWRFKIRNGIKFSDGTSLSLSDVEFSIEEALQKQWPVERPLLQISNVNIVEDQIEIKTSTPLPELPLHLKSLFIVSKNKGPEDTYLGTGPYKLVKNQLQVTNGQIQEQKIELLYNQFSTSKPPVKNVNYHYLSKARLDSFSENAIEDSFQIIQTGVLNSENEGKLLSEDFSKTSIPMSKLGVLFINLNSSTPDFPNQNNPFRGLNTRQAIARVLQPTNIITEAGIEARTAFQPAGILVFGYNPQLHRLGPDKKEAMMRLKEEGYPNGFTFTLQVQEDKYEIGNVVARQLKQLGLTVIVNIVDSPAEVNQIRTGNFTLYLGGWVNDYQTSTSVFTSGLISGGSENYTKYSNPELDERITKLATVFDTKDRERDLQEMMSVAMTDYPWLSLWEELTVMIVSDKINLAPSTGFVLGADISGK